MTLKIGTGTLWLFCRVADRARVRRIPRACLVPYGIGPLTVEACLDVGPIVAPDVGWAT